MKRFLSFLTVIGVLLLVTTAFAVDLKYAGSVTILDGIMKDAAPTFEKKTGYKIGMSGGDSGGGIKATLSGLVDIGGVSRDLSEDEKKQGLIPYTIGLDAVAIVVNRDIPVDNLSSKVLKDIGTGKIHNWKEIGGPDLPIKLVIGPPAASARELFQKIILEHEPYTDGVIVSPVKNISETVSKTTGSIGVLPLSLVDEKIVKIIKVDGIFPETTTVKNKKYKIVRSLNLITKGPATGKAKEFIDFMLSPEGQAIVEKNGFVRIK